jgi:uncharacterized protein (DUF1697 family)
MYVAVLRGINVSGRHLIKMEALRHALQLLGFQQITTYIQSGNMIFHSDIKDEKTLENMISNMILQHFGYDIPCIVIHRDELDHIINQNPLSAQLDKDVTFFHVTLLAEKPKSNDIATLREKKQPEEEIFLVDRTVYLYCPNGYGKTKLTNNLIESKLKVSATTRNWKTLQELFKMTSQTVHK